MSGYQILDFKNSELSGSGIMIPGLYHIVENTKKPLLITNISSILGNNISKSYYANNIVNVGNEWRITFSTYRIDIATNDNVTAISLSEQPAILNERTDI